MPSLSTTKLALACFLCVALSLLLTTFIPSLKIGYGQEQYSFVTQWGAEGIGVASLSSPLRYQ